MPKIAPLLDELRAETDKLTDEETRNRFRELVDDVEARVEDDVDLPQRILEAIERFEGEHPDATNLLNRIMTLLGGAGL